MRLLERLIDILASEIKQVGRQIETAAREHQAEEEKRVSSPVVVNAVLQRAESEVNAEESRQTRHEGRDRIRLLIECLGLGIAGILALANVGLWIVTISAAHATRDAADAAQRGAAASEAQAEATKESIQSTVQSFRLDQRAWVGQMDSSASEAEEGKPITFRVVIGNSGKTPALNVRMAISSAHAPKAVKFIPRYSGPNTAALQGTGAMQPGAKGLLEQTTGPLVDVSKYQRGEYLYYVFGRIDYEDVFGRPHWTTWCLYVGGEHTGNMRSPLQCNSYNNTDDAPKK
jgi:hypothetical protein